MFIEIEDTFCLSNKHELGTKADCTLDPSTPRANVPRHSEESKYKFMGFLLKKAKSTQIESEVERSALEAPRANSLLKGRGSSSASIGNPQNMLTVKVVRVTENLSSDNFLDPNDAFKKKANGTLTKPVTNKNRPSIMSAEDHYLPLNLQDKSMQVSENRSHTYRDPSKNSFFGEWNPDQKSSKRMSGSRGGEEAIEMSVGIDTNVDYVPILQRNAEFVEFCRRQSQVEQSGSLSRTNRLASLAITLLRSEDLMDGN